MPEAPCAACCRFVTKAELAKLGLGHLLGTPLLRAYMHGYFLHNRLHAKAKALAQPFAYEAYREQRVSAKLDAERKSRIGLVRKLPKVRVRGALLLSGRVPLERQCFSLSIVATAQGCCAGASRGCLSIWQHDLSHPVAPSCTCPCCAVTASSAGAALS